MTRLPAFAFGVLFVFAGCKTTSEEPAEDGVVAASEETRQALGVARWRTKDAPAAIEGLDENDEVIVALEHGVAVDGVDAVHTIELREGNRGIARQFRFSDSTTGDAGFSMLGEKRTAGYEASHVIGRLEADLRSASGSTASALTASSMAPSEDTLISCGGTQLVVDDTDFKYCLSDNPTEVLAWCPEQFRKYGKCKQVGVKTPEPKHSN
jgi:hypothetical protein